MAYRRQIDNRGHKQIHKDSCHTVNDGFRNISFLGRAARSITKARLRQVGTRVNGHLVARLQSNILTRDGHIAIGCTDGDTRKRIDVHGTKGRLDIDLTFMAKHLHLIYAITVTNMNTTRQILTAFGKIVKAEHTTIETQSR